MLRLLMLPTKRVVALFGELREDVCGGSGGRRSRPEYCDVLCFAVAFWLDCGIIDAIAQRSKMNY
jgi:hypothetical protein